MQFTSYRSINSSLLIWLDNQRPDRRGPMAWLHICLRTVAITHQEFRKNDLSLRSSALTFTILLALVPVLAMSTAVLKGLGGDNHLKQLAYSYIATLEQQTVPANGIETTPTPATVSIAGHLRAATENIFD